MPQQSCAKHAGGVHNKQVADRNQFNKVGKRTMADITVRTVYYQQATGVARLERVLCNEFIR